MLLEQLPRPWRALGAYASGLLDRHGSAARRSAPHHHSSRAALLADQLPRPLPGPRHAGGLATDPHARVVARHYQRVSACVHTDTPSVHSGRRTARGPQPVLRTDQEARGFARFLTFAACLCKRCLQRQHSEGFVRPPAASSSAVLQVITFAADLDARTTSSVFPLVDAARGLASRRRTLRTARHRQAWQACLLLKGRVTAGPVARLLLPTGDAGACPKTPGKTAGAQPRRLRCRSRRGSLGSSLRSRSPPPLAEAASAGSSPKESHRRAASFRDVFGLPALLERVRITL